MMHRSEILLTLTVSLVFGLISVFPAIAMRLDPMSGFRGIEMQGTDAEYHYAARVREVMDGYPLAANVFAAGNKDQPYLQPSAPEWVIAHLGSIFGLDAARTLILSQFLFGAIVFAVLVGCFQAITGRVLWSLAGVSTYLFAGYIFSGPTMIVRLIAGTQGATEFLTFARLVNPQWSATLFFGALWALAVWIRSRSRKTLLVAGVLTALSFYSYIYSWTLLGLIFVFIVVKALLDRDFVRVKELAVLAAGLVLAFLPYAWNLWQATHHPFYAETSMRFGLIQSRQAVFGMTLVMLPVLVAVFWKRLGRMAWLALAFAAASIIAQNQQLVTGQALAVAHYHWFFIKPFAMILLTIMAMSLVYDRWGRRLLSNVKQVWLMAPVILALATFGTLYQYRSYQAALPFWREQQKAAGVLNYLRDHTRPGDVTYAEGFVRDLIPVYTSGDVYWAINAGAYLSSDKWARDAYFFDLWIAGVSADDAARTFPTSRREELSSRIHAIYYREVMHGRPPGFGAIPDDEVRSHIDAYLAFLSETDEQKIKKYPLTYVVFAAHAPATLAIAWLRDHSDGIYKDDAFEMRKMR